MSEPTEAPPSMRDQIVAVLARELTGTRIVRTGGPTAAALAHRFEGSEIEGEGLTAYEAVPDEHTVAVVTHGTGGGETGMTTAVTLGTLADALADAIANGDTPRKIPFGFTIADRP